MSDSPLTICLSGGGHRASVFSLGALMYLVDSARNRNVDSIVSVSGGSITNAFVAQECDFQHVTAEEFDRIASRFVRTIVEKGVLFSAWQTAAYLILIVGLGVYLLIEAVFDWPTNLPWYGLLIGIAALFSLLTARGMLLNQLLAHRFFRPHGRPSRVSGLATTVEHVFCATDLNSGAPFFVVTAEGGKLVSSLGSVPAGDFKLTDAVRASAAFPIGFPPKRLSLKRFGLVWKDRIVGIEPGYVSMFQRRPEQRNRLERALEALRAIVPHAVFLSDGGVWNNLATDWMLRRSHGPSPRAGLVVDASAPLASAPLHHLHLPGVAEMAAMARSMSILYSNTVDPRVQGLESVAAGVLRRRKPEDDPAETDAERAHGVLPVVMRITEGRGQLLNRYRRILRAAGLSVSDDLLPGGKRLKQIDQVWSRFWEEHRRKRKPGQAGIRLMSSGVGTTLGRLDSDIAVWLMAHGYLNAMTCLHVYCDYPFGTLTGIDRFTRLLDDEPRGYSPGFKLNNEVL